MIYKNDRLYFVGNDGYFYSVDVNKYNSFNKIVKVDNRPNPNKYLIKKLMCYGDFIYFSSDTGKLFCYDLSSGKHRMLDVSQGIPLIGSPIEIIGSIYTVDKNSNVYAI